MKKNMHVISYTIAAVSATAVVAYAAGYQNGRAQSIVIAQKGLIKVLTEKLYAEYNKE